MTRCIEGLKVLSESLFGVRFREVALCPGESWHPDVLKLSLHHPDEVNKWIYALSDVAIYSSGRITEKWILTLSKSVPS